MNASYGLLVSLLVLCLLGVTPASAQGDGDCYAISPYPPGDPIYMEVIVSDTFCCDTDWDGLCQTYYDRRAGTGEGEGEVEGGFEGIIEGEVLIEAPVSQVAQCYLNEMVVQNACAPLRDVSDFFYQSCILDVLGPCILGASPKRLFTLREIFELLDVNGDGTLSVGELRQSAQSESPVHAADLDGNDDIGLSELLRVIQLFSSGGYGCAANAGVSEDGYVAGAGVETCFPHSSDYQGTADFEVSFSELVRLIQLYNSLGYAHCPLRGTEDGYCPVN